MIISIIDVNLSYELNGCKFVQDIGKVTIGIANSLKDAENRVNL